MGQHRRSEKEIASHVGVISRFVRQKRKQLDYTQEEFATRVGVGLRFLRELELGKESLRMDKVNQVLNFLGHELVPGKIDFETKDKE